MPLISQSEAARLAGVSRQAIGKLKDKYSFFSDKGKVDTDHAQWTEYLNERKVNQESVKNTAEKKQVKKSKKKSGSKSVKKKAVKKSKKKSGKKLSDSKLLKKESKKQKHALTGGYDPALMIPTSPSQLKALTDIQEKNINMQVKLQELIDIEMVISILEVVARDIGSIRNLGRKVSGLICLKLDSVGMEKQVEKIIDSETENIIKMIKKNMSQNIDIKSYEE